MSPLPENSAEPVAESADQTISIDYIKSRHFRVIHADGVWGGLSPHLDLQIAFWNARAAIPQHQLLRLDKDGKHHEEERIVRADQVREVETLVVMDLGVAKAFQKWLADKIERLEKALSEIQMLQEVEEADADGN